MDPTSWRRMVDVAVMVLAGELCLGCPLSFAPGWANGWPGGLSIYVVWSAWMTTWILLILLTLAIGVAAYAGLFISRRGLGRHWGRRLFAAWIAMAVILTLLACRPLYREIHTSTLQMWPNGYPDPGAIRP
jgi:hypothetical protein